MAHTRRWWRPGLALLGTFGLLAGSLAVRWPSADDLPTGASEVAPSARLGAGDHDPPTGAVLIDLADDISAAERARLSEEIRRAIEPYDWSRGTDALGETLSGPAELYRITPPASEVRDILEALAGHPSVEAVEVERMWTVPEPPGGLEPFATTDAPDRRPDEGFVPNDPYYKHQWNMEQIQMPRAWRSNRGEGAVVAIIDTGVLYRDHGRFRQAPDLASTRFVPGHDFVDDDDQPDDEHGHGTHVAGTVAQSTNNGIGVAGVAPNAAIMPIRVLNRNGAGSWGAVAAGIRWAADNGANVINMSLGGGTSSRAIANAIKYAHGKGVTVIAAAGNTGRGRVQYPAAHAEAIAVGAVRFDGERTFYSSYGPGLALMAPGGDLRVDQDGDGLPDGVLQNTMVRGNPARHDYLAFQGTSMAAPHAAGAAALLWGEGVRNPSTIESLLRRTAEDKGAANDYGDGILKAGDALAAATGGLTLLRMGVAALLLLLSVSALRRRGKLGVAPLPALGVAFVWVGALRLLPVELVLPSADRWLGAFPYALSAAPELTLPLLASAALPLLATALFLSVGRLRPALVGLSVGTGAYLVVEALVPTTNWVLGPVLLAGPWLVLQAGITGWLARTAAVRS